MCSMLRNLSKLWPSSIVFDCQGLSLLCKQDCLTMQANKALQGAAAQAALANAAATGAAHVILADPGQQPNTGVVLSIAPLLGADAAVDRSHPRWLHIHVRPPVRGLLKLLKVECALYVPWLQQLQCHMLTWYLLAGLWERYLFA